MGEWTTHAANGQLMENGADTNLLPAKTSLMAASKSEAIRDLTTYPDAPVFSAAWTKSGSS
jgi:hypothetical protein